MPEEYIYALFDKNGIYDIGGPRDINKPDKRPIEDCYVFRVDKLYKELTEHLDTLLFQVSIAPEDVKTLFKQIGETFNKEAQKEFIIREYNSLDISKAFSPSMCHFNTDICMEILPKALLAAFDQANLLSNSKERGLFISNESFLEPLIGEYLRRICRYFSSNPYCKLDPTEIWEAASQLAIEQKAYVMVYRNIGELEMALTETVNAHIQTIYDQEKKVTVAMEQNYGDVFAWADIAVSQFYGGLIKTYERIKIKAVGAESSYCQIGISDIVKLFKTAVSETNMPAEALPKKYQKIFNEAIEKTVAEIPELVKKNLTVGEAVGLPGNVENHEL